MADTPTPSRPDNARAAEDADALHCPGCGYNLHGVCTPQTPTGRCPECGLWFVRVQLLERLNARAPMSMSLLVMQLLLFPIVIGFTPLCCVGGFFAIFDDADVPPDTYATFSFTFAPLLVAFLVGGLLAKQYYPASVSGIAPEHRRGMQRHIILPWLLFFVIEAVLTAVYFVGGCAAILAGLGLL